MKISPTRSSLTQRIDEIEHFLSEAVAVVNRIHGTRENFSDRLFRKTHNDLSRITRLALCSLVERSPNWKKNYESKCIKLCDKTFRTLLETHIDFCVKECNTFLQDYRHIQIGDIDKEREKVNDIKDILNALDQKEDVPIEQLKQAFGEISTILRAWNAARPELDKKKKPWAAIFGCIAGIVAFLAGVVTIVVGFVTMIRFFFG